MCAFSSKCEFSIHESTLYLLFPPLPEQFSLEALCGGLDSTQNSVGAGWKLGTLLGVGRGSKSEQRKEASRKEVGGPRRCQSAFQQSEEIPEAIRRGGKARFVSWFRGPNTLGCSKTEHHGQKQVIEQN